MPGCWNTRAGLSGLTTMTMFDPAAQERAATDLADRTVRALTDDLLVVADAPGLYRVYGKDGDEYTVNAETGACTCPDTEYRDPDGGCKHVRRVEFHTGERAVPAWVDRDAVDPLLVKRLADSVDGDGDAQAQVVATDGGQEIVVAGDEGELIDGDEDENAPGYTRHRESPRQGRKEYVRCEGCGRELLVELGGRDGILHPEGCPTR